MSAWTGKVVLVTGASSGLGRKIATAFAREFAFVVLVGRDERKLSEVAEELRLTGGEVLAIPADVTVQADVDRLIGDAVRRYGRLDVLVNNVGKSDRGRLTETPAEKFADLLNVNFLSTVRCTHAALPHLLVTKGHVVNIGSLASKSASRFLGAYAASKFPLAAYSQQLRLELRDEGLHVLLVCPGPLAREDSGSRYDHLAHDLPESARQPGGGVRVSRLSPDDVAQRILLACERRQPELVIPMKARLLFAISQLFPRLGDWLVTQMTG